MKTINEILEIIYFQHDTICNQKYDKILPYSFHLKCVIEQGKKYYKSCFNGDKYYNSVIIACAGHDLIEDARFSYSDVADLSGIFEADIIYACTDEKGKNRKQRHSDKFFEELSQNRFAVYVKLCDIISNVLYSLLTNSSMYSKYQDEFPRLFVNLYKEGEYEEVWSNLKKLLKYD